MVQSASRGAQFAFCSVVLPASSVLEFFLDCGRHMFPLVVRSNGGFKQLP
jgi:hypothetical protein